MTNQPSIRLATWNLDRPSLTSWKRLPVMRKVFDVINADIWVLTESRTTLAPAAGLFGLHSEPHPARRPDQEERWVSVWSKWPLRRIQERPTPWSLTVMCDSLIGPLLIRGLVLPYHAEPPETSLEPTGHWTQFSRELRVQADDWRRLRKLYPRIPLVIAGDFNNSIDGSTYYGTASTRAELAGAIEGSSLRCVTGEDVVETGKLVGNHLIDHVCVSAGLEVLGDITCWQGWSEKADGTKTTMSDHPGVAVQLANASGR